ncbi:MAG: sulfatase [Planctomycetota bacterium]|jgi:arylsulfatase A-like enzyme
MSAEQERSTAPNAAALTVLGALSAAAFANLASVLAAGGYDFEILGVSVRSSTPGRPLAILIFLIALRWILSLKGVGLGRSLKGLSPWGLVVIVLGGAVFVASLVGGRSAVPAWAAASVAVAAVAGFALAWTSWREPSSRFVVAVCFLAVSPGLAVSLSSAKNWARTFGLVEEKFAADTVVAANAVGLLSGRGAEFSLEKTPIGNDWRDAVVLSPGGFFSSKSSIASGGDLRFSVARRGNAGGLSAVVTLVTPSGNQTCFNRKAADLPADAWEDVSISVRALGDVEILFESVGGDSGGEVIFANPRVPGQSPSLGHLNVMLVVVDALRSDRMSLYGYGKPTCPEIDELASSAVVFENALSQSSWTVPSTATIFTSLYPTAHGANSTEHGLSGDLATVAEKLGEAGYVTAAFQPNALLAPQAGFAQGFARYFHYPTRRPTALDENRYVRADVMNADVMKWLDAAPQAPFFLYLHYMDVHDPYCPPDEFRRFGEDESGLYDGEIAYFSTQFAALFEDLKKRGLLSSTIIVLASDHGEQFLEHGATRHGKSLYSEELSVPLVIWHPNTTGGRVSERSSGIDIAPTILEAAGVAALGEAEGHSLLGAVLGGALDPRPVTSELHTIYPPGQHLVSVTEGPRRFIVSNPGTSSAVKIELYDLENDPSERVNLAASQGGRVRKMLERVEAFDEAQSELHGRLVPEEFLLPLSDERKKQLKALGYLAN